MERNIKAKFNRLNELDRLKVESEKEINKIISYIQENYGCPNCGGTTCGSIWRNCNYGTWTYKCSRCGFSTGEETAVRILCDWLLLIEEAHQKLVDKVHKYKEEKESKDGEEA